MVVRRILVAADFSAEGNHAVRYGYRLAQRLRAEVALLHVCDGAPSSACKLQPGTVAGDPHTRLVHDLSVMAIQCGADGVCTRVMVRTGCEGPALLAAARELPAELIVVGMHQLHGIEHALLDAGIDERLGGTCCPVIAVPMPPADAPNHELSLQGYR